jgi:hypothetical protein
MRIETSAQGTSTAETVGDETKAEGGCEHVSEHKRVCRDSHDRCNCCFRGVNSYEQVHFGMNDFCEA